MIALSKSLFGAEMNVPFQLSSLIVSDHSCDLVNLDLSARLNMIVDLI